MGETTSKYRGMTPEQIAETLSSRMIGVLGTGHASTHSARVIGARNSITALMDRGLVHRDRRWTRLGLEVARLVMSNVKTIDELHEQALSLNVNADAHLPVAGVPGTSLGEMREAFRADDEISVVEPMTITPSGAAKIAAAVERNRAGKGTFGADELLVGKYVRVVGTQACRGLVVDVTDHGRSVHVQMTDRLVIVDPINVEPLDAEESDRVHEQLAAAGKLLPPEPTMHYMSGDLLDACGTAPRGQRLSVTPVAAAVTCEPCKRIAAGEPEQRERIDVTSGLTDAGRVFEPGYEPTPTAERVTRADGVVFVVGDVVTWAKGPDAETQWRIDTLYVPHTGDLEPYAGMSAVEQPKYGTRGTAGQLSLLRHAGRPGVVGVGMAGWHELEDPAVTVERIVRRAQYNALRKMLEVLDGWTRGARENHDALGHRGESVPCWSQFARADIIVMVADAACELGTFDPTRAVGDV